MFKARISKWQIGKYRKHKKGEAIQRPQGHTGCSKSRKQSDDGTAIQLLAPKPCSMKSPRNLETLERVLVLLDRYISGSFQTGRWMPTSPCGSRYGRGEISKDIRRSSGDAAEDFSSHVMYGCFTLDNRDLRGTERAFAKASACIEGMLKRDNPSTVLAIFSLLALKQRGKHELAICLLRQMSALSSIFLGSNHPLPNMYSCLATADMTSWEELSSNSLKKSIETCSKLIHNARSGTPLDVIPCAHNPMLNCILQRMQVLCGQAGSSALPVRILYVCMGYARSLERLGLNANAIHVVEHVLAHDISTEGDPQQLLAWKTKALMFLSTLYEREEEQCQAEEKAKEAIKLALTEGEWGGPQDLWFLLELETQSRKLGLVCEAARIQGRRVRATELLNRADDT